MDAQKRIKQLMEERGWTDYRLAKEANLSHSTILSKIKPYAFTLFAKKYGEEKLLDCLERNEKNGVVYHRDGINGDYDDFDDVDQLMNFILTGVR